MTQRDEELLEIDEDYPCLHCGYNLRGVLVAGRCPECGTLIRDTFERPAPPTTRQLVAQGCLVLALFAAAVLVMIALWGLRY